MSKKPTRKKPLHEKYFYYERSVQSVGTHLKWYRQIFQENLAFFPLKLREDFCGTFLHAKEWIDLAPDHTAVGIDLDSEPLNYGKRVHLPKLTPEARARLTILQEDVLKIRKPVADFVIACNFSFYIFQQRELLREYFRGVYESLGSKGMLILEMAGGPGMIEEVRERKTVRYKTSVGKPEKFQYIWDQRGFDPIHNRALYSIHFKFEDGREMRDAFTYDWRLWTIPEIREILAEAGFQKSGVYWETSHKAEGTGEYTLQEKGDNAYAWIATVVGIKSAP